MWKRYVDDCFAVIRTSQIEDFLKFINTINTNILFTVERENNGTLPFLDIKIEKQLDGKLQFSVYRKPTSNDRYLDFNSNNPTSHKINTIMAL